MKTDVTNESQIQTLNGGWFITNTLRNMVSSIQSCFHQEHDVQTNGHTTIHASGKIYERGRVEPVALGDTQSVFLKASDFTGSGAMTWTINAGAGTTEVRYVLVGSQMRLDFYVTATTVGGTPNRDLQIKIPGGFYPAYQSYNLCRIVDNGTVAVGLAFAVVGDNRIHVARNDLANWAASAAATTIHGQLWFETRTA